MVVPAKFRPHVLKVAHGECGHFGVQKTYLNILKHFFWPLVKRDVARYIKVKELRLFKVVKALMQFISIFDIMKVIQSDQGSNFSSQVLKLLCIKRNQSSAYQAQSQGARFHQNLVSLAFILY